MKPLILLCLSLAAGMSAQTTTRTHLKVAEKPVKGDCAAVAALCDTLASPAPHTVDINGYDKPLRSRRETFFVTNNSARDVTGLAVNINYYDSSRRQLHSRRARINVSIPAGETRQASLRSWDEQQSFYYVHSAVPSRVSQATPFEVTITVDTLFVQSR